MPREPDISDPDIARTAAEWVARRDRGLSLTEARAFAVWRAADLRHELELARLASAWRKLDSVGAAPELDAMATTFLDRAQARRRGRRILRVASLTFSAAAVLAVGLYSWNRFSPAETARASQRVMENYRVLASTMQRDTLPDGSVAELNGTSRIEVDYSATQRRVRLVEGEAHFVVEKDPYRPFFVTAGTVTVRAVGTAFNVRLESAKVEVLVTEGKVKLEQSPSVATPVPEMAFVEASPALIQGQRAVINLMRVDAPAKVEINEVNPGEMTDALGWQTTRLVFNNTPLDEVIAGFNRYNSHRLTLGDARLRGRTLTGVFRADNLDGFVRLLQASVDVRADPRSPAETVLLPVR